MKALKLLVYFWGLLLLFSCAEEKHQPLFEGEKPDAVSSYRVENKPGAAVINYTLNDPRTSYVKAVYTLKEGLTREAKASKFDDKLLVDGFAESKEYSITLYAVGEDEQLSEPTHVSVHPGTPPFRTVVSELEAKADWGGGKISGANETNAKLMIGVLRKDNQGVWQEVDMFFTESERFDFNFRGLDPVETQFGIYVRDRWQNFSDTVLFAFAPWEEIQVPISSKNFNSIVLPGDVVHRGVYAVSRLFDGLTDTWTNGFYAADEASWPKTFTVDMGKPYQLSRFKLFQNANVYYQSANAKHIRIYGNNTLDLNYDNWILLGEWDDWRPSKRPPSTGKDGLTEEDLAAAEAGNDFDFPLDIPGVRYIRFQVVNTWEPRLAWFGTELQFWGRPTN